tara:strand:+ start:840 stop:1685 length:846 start_codon:yes stop_codon:yes gene_type:complete
MSIFIKEVSNIMNEEIRMKAIKDELTDEEWQELITIPTKQAVKEYWPLVQDEKRRDGVTPSLKDEKALSDLLHRAFHKNNINGTQERHQKRNSKTSGGKGGRIWLNRVDCLEFLSEWIPIASQSNGRIHFDWGKIQKGVVAVETLKPDTHVLVAEPQQVVVEAEPTPQTFLEKAASLILGLKERFSPQTAIEAQPEITNESNKELEETRWGEPNEPKTALRTSIEDINDELNKANKIVEELNVKLEEAKKDEQEREALLSRINADRSRLDELDKKALNKTK